MIFNILFTILYGILLGIAIFSLYNMYILIKKRC